MIRTTIAKAHIKRTFRPNYGWDQMTPKSMYLDPAWDRSTPIFPGMCMMKTAGENVSLINGTGVPYGLSGLYIGGDGIDEVLEQGVNACAVWVLAADAEAEVLSPAFKPDEVWTDPGNGTIVLVHASTTGASRGQLVPAGSAATPSGRPIARLLKVVSATKIVIGGLTGTQ